MRIIFGLLLLAATTFGVVAGNAPAPEEQEIRGRVDSIVSNLLFDRGLSDAASYNVRENGHVIIIFDEAVETPVYTEVVQTLRANPVVPAVTAEQGGRSVCELP